MIIKSKFRPKIICVVLYKIKKNNRSVKINKYKKGTQADFLARRFPPSRRLAGGKDADNRVAGTPARGRGSNPDARAIPREPGARARAGEGHGHSACRDFWVIGLVFCSILAVGFSYVCR